MAWMPAIIAAAHRREEQERLEQLRNEDSRGVYEFKILRSYRFAFADQARLDSALAEEAQAGWQLAAQLDGRRLILRRPRSQRDTDAVRPPGIDPYRTEIDSKLPLLAGALSVVLLVVLLAVGGLGITVFDRSPATAVGVIAVTIIGLGILILLLLWKAWRRP